MLKHNPIPTDGAELSTKAVTNCVQFANEINARISGLTVTPMLHHLGLDKTQIMNTANKQKDHANAPTQRLMSSRDKEFKAFDAACQTLHCSRTHRQDDIAKTAATQGCDVVFHALIRSIRDQSADAGVDIHQVLTHTQIPLRRFAD